MRKVLCSPGSYIQQEGAMGQLAQEYAAIGSTGAHLLVDPTIDKLYHNQIVSSFDQGKVPYQLMEFGGECCQEEIERHRQHLGQADVIIGIGGGKTLDTAKAVAHFSHLPVIIVPTAASSDAPCSRLSVLYTPQGVFDRYLPLPSNPNVVIMDTDIIAKAPARFLIAGLGDAFATYYEAAACVQSNATTMTGGHATNASFALAKLCHDTLLEDSVKAIAAAKAGVRTAALENIIEANTLLSGLGFESSGLAAAHSIHDGMTALAGTHKMLHGEKVAFGTLAQLILEDRPLEEVKEVYGYFHMVGLPTTLAEIGIGDASDEDLLKVGELACGPDETMGNMPFEVTPIDVAHAMRAADELNKVL
ncbi:glycerol dehydrogenase [Bifidobacterium aemilianum]|uniref:Glycerol dehydrogenase n=1 Tax=Bifidobacterium aemilianum TaxID=2493120 RepID=A0A366K701_9BIFI|nr:glycerol dehydrogenase [Bifidobacterium aemilianum]RBP97515.1 glycerol dehydrogenase [Bifidobacterium aemilianum]